MKTGTIFVVACLMIAGTPAGTRAQELPSGTWRVDGNGFQGVLSIASDAEGGRVSGTILGDALNGTYEPKTRCLQFVRLRDGAVLQNWKGYIFLKPDPKTGDYSMAGLFTHQEMSGFEETGWYATQDRTLAGSNPVAREVLVNDLKRLQGDWQISVTILPTNQKSRFPDELRLNDPGTRLAIDGHHLKVAGTVVASVDNEMPKSPHHKEVGLGGYRLIVLTTPQGKAVSCSYFIKENGEVEMAYPHTCFCHRGSGQILTLKRPKAVETGGATVEVRKP